MRPSLRVRVRLALACAAAVLTSSCGADRARTCATDADCPADAFCLEGACRADVSPIAVIGIPADPLTTHRKLVFDGSGSSDADPGDAIATWSWSIATVSAACEPVPASAIGSTFETRFQCPGQYQVELVVTDARGIASQPATLLIAVDLLPDPPTVAVDPPLPLGHQCSGSPLLCTTVDAAEQRAFQLVALATSPAPGSLTYHWTAEAPPGVDPEARVTFEPGAGEPSPWVRIETDGTAIAGTWTFAVEVTDSRNAVAGATAQVTVGNRPPIVVPGGGLVTVPHVFDPVGLQFVAQGETPPAAIADPDGDPIVGRDFTHASSGDGGNAFVLTPFPDRAAFGIVVAYAEPADAAFLVGAGVRRSISFTATDVNGGATTATWEVLVANRPPRVSVAVPAASVPHWFDPVCSSYLATASLATFVDDDGDPLVHDASTGSALCQANSLSAGTVGVVCTVPWIPGDPLLAALPTLVTTHVLTATVRDPWSSASDATSLTVTNTPPRFTGGPILIPTTCALGDCCDLQCADRARGAAAAAGSIPTPVVDDDGDPVTVTYDQTGTCVNLTSPVGSYTCFSGSCPEVHFSVCAVTPACVTPPPATGSFQVHFQDGVDGGLAPFTVSGTCP